MDNVLFESLRVTTKKWAAGQLKEADVATSEYSDKKPAAPDLGGAIADIVHQWDTYKLDPTFPDNVKGKLTDAIGTINPANTGKEAEVGAEQKKDDAQVASDLAGDTQALKDQYKFIPEATIAGNVNPGNVGADKETDKELARDNDQVQKDMSAELKNNKDILQKTQGVKNITAQK